MNLSPDIAYPFAEIVGDRHGDDFGAAMRAFIDRHGKNEDKTYSATRPAGHHKDAEKNPEQ